LEDRQSDKDMDELREARMQGKLRKNEKRIANNIKDNDEEY